MLDRSLSFADIRELISLEDVMEELDYGMWHAVTPHSNCSLISVDLCGDRSQRRAGVLHGVPDGECRLAGRSGERGDAI